MNKYHDFAEYHMNNKVLISVGIYIEIWTLILCLILNHKLYPESMFSFMYSTKSSHGNFNRYYVNVAKRLK